MFIELFTINSCKKGIRTRIKIQISFYNFLLQVQNREVLELFVKLVIDHF